MKHDALRLWLAGVGLALLEVAWTLAHGGDLFLSLGERALYAMAALGGLGGCVMLLGLLLRLAGRSTGARWVLAASAAASAASLCWLLTTGRRVHDAAWRVPVVVLVAALALGAAYVGAARIAHARQLRRWLTPALAGMSAAACLALDVLVLPRGYPAFHLALLLGALVSASVAALASWFDVGRRARWLGVLACLTVGVAPLALARLAAHPTASFAVRESAPWGADLLALLDHARPGTPASAAPVRAEAEPPPAPGAGVDLRDRDVLLISVDALRADLLRAYGGRGRTPVLDALADESAVFTRAYTPAPHTSYALASLLTGKFVKPLVTLGGALGDPPTLPDRLRRYGYRSAAFYPPAIFFVDGARFEALAQRGFGFEYRKEMFASAEERVAQLSAYLDHADPKRPLFAWVHLFEPHEPYDPPADSPHDGSERSRYEAEVAACDRAIAALITRFRAARPRATVIITADHGEEFGDHGGSFHGSTLYDEQVRVPLLWSSPGTVTARRIDAPVELVDVGTTLLSTAGIPRDARMRGDDLGPLLAGASDAGPRHAFSSLDARHMITDGRFKAICDLREPHCALFDLVRDPAETRNLAGVEAAVAARLRAALEAFLTSIPRSEALTASDGVGMPDLLARARLGVEVRAAELVPLLQDARGPVRAEAARQLGARGDAQVLTALQTVRDHDVDAHARAEAAVASFRCGDDAARPRVIALLEDAAHPLDLRRRAALALAARGHAAGLDVLATLVRDESANESERKAAIDALASLRAPAAVAPLSDALQSVRLREVAARALGEVGGDAARALLTAQLHDERYPPARRAEAEALSALGEPRTAGLIVRFLGMESGLPGGLRLLDGLAALAPHGVRLADARVRRGAWSCSTDGACAPDAHAAVALPTTARRGPVRVVIWYRGAEPGATLIVDGARFALSASEDQLSLLRSSAASVRRLSLARAGQVGVVAVAVVPARAEIPPPAPEPWDAGAPSDAPPR